MQKKERLDRLMEKEPLPTFNYDWDIISKLELLHIRGQIPRLAFGSLGMTFIDHCLAHNS